MDLYKTKLCSLFQRGNCRRQSCSFAHGDEELRKTPWGRRDYKRFSPRRRSPFRRDERRRYSRDRTASYSRSPVRSSISSPQATKRSGQHTDKGDGKKSRTENGADSKHRTEANSLAEKLHVAEVDVEALNHQKTQLEGDLHIASRDIQVQQARNKELESELDAVQAENKRLVSKIKKVAKAYKRCLRSDDESKRARLKLDKLLEEEFKLRGDDSDANNATSEGEHDKVNGDFLHVALLPNGAENGGLQRRKNGPDALAKEALGDTLDKVQDTSCRLIDNMSCINID